MRQTRLPILFILMLLSALGALAQDPVPKPVSARFPNIRASLDDGFFVLAEQQARGVLNDGPSKAKEREAALLLAHALWGQKRYSELVELLEQYNGEPGYVYWRARGYFELKQYEEALAVLADFSEEMKESRYAAPALRLKGHMEQADGKLAEAEATYQQFAKQFPEHRERIENQFNLAEVYRAQKRIPEAIALYETLAEDVNVNVASRAQLKLAHVLYTQGAEENFDTARSVLAGLSTNTQVRLAYRIDACVDLAALEEKDGRKKESMASMRKGIALSPDARQRVPLKLALARMLLREGDTTGALKLLEECRAEAPNERIAAELQLEKAGALLQAKRSGEAEEAYQVYLAVATNPDGLAQAYLGRGLALWSLKRYAEAAATLDKAVKELRPPQERASALFKAGDAYYQAGKFEEAEKRYRSYIADFPESEHVPNALYQLGLALAPDEQNGDADRVADALATFQTLEEKYASSPFAEKAALRAADVLRATDQWEAALDKYAQISLTYTNSPATQEFSGHQRGMVLWELGRYPDAQLAFEAVVKNHAGSEYAQQASYMRGRCLYRQGQVEEAVKACMEFVAQFPDSEWRPEVIFWLAEQYFNRGNYQEAEPLFLSIADEYKAHRLAPRALYWAGRSAAALSNYVKAIERYSAVAKTYPESEILPQTRFAQGDALTELGEFARAILAFEEVIKNYPQSDLVNAAWGRKGDCQFSLATENPARYSEAVSAYQSILDRASAPMALKLQAEYKIGRCLEKTGQTEKAFSRYMNVVYTFINERIEHSTYSVMWFTRSAFGAAALKEKERAWLEAAQVYGRVIEANVPAAEEALKRIEKIRKDNWLLFQEAEETDHVGTDG